VISFNLSQGLTLGEWRVDGLVENRSQNAVGQVRLRVDLFDAAGEIVAEGIADALMSNLLPGESSPFSVSFDIAAAPIEAQIQALPLIPVHQSADGQPADDVPIDDQQAINEPVDDQFADGRETDHRPELVFELDEFFVTGSGELAIMGSVTNPGSRHVALDSIGFLGRAPDGGVKLVAEMQFGPSQLGPGGDSAPFLALAPQNPGAVQWTAFHDGRIVKPPNAGSLEILGVPKLHLTAQGAPFVVGTLTNSGDDPIAGSVMVSLFDGNRLIGLWQVETPRPLGAGEQLPFVAFGFPGVSLRFDPGDPDAIRVETRVEDSAADPAPPFIELPIDVSAFLSVGSAIFIRGTIRNPMDFEVDAATVYAEVRSTFGELVTAGWSRAETLAPGASAAFVLDLPIPVGLNATLTEYDLRAIGLKAQP
jgi:hypothetical protein